MQSPKNSVRSECPSITWHQGGYLCESMFNQFLCGLELISGDLKDWVIPWQQGFAPTHLENVSSGCLFTVTNQQKMSFSQPQTVEGLGQFGCVQPIKKIDQPMFEKLLTSYIPTWRIISPTKWLVTLVRKSPIRGFSMLFPYKWVVTCYNYGYYPVTSLCHPLFQSLSFRRSARSASSILAAHQSCHPAAALWTPTISGPFVDDL